MLWVDKYRPTALDKLDYHKEQALQLAKLVSVHLARWRRSWEAVQPVRS